MKLSIIAVLGIIVAAAGCGPSKQSQGAAAPAQVRSIWQTQPLYVDGSDNDWTRPLPYLIREEKLSYSISNDQQNLYILLTTTSPQQEQKIIQGGMSVWINTKGDQSIGDAVGIGYPLDDRNDRDRKLMEDAQPQRYQNKPARLEDKRTYALYGFNKDSTIRRFSYRDSNSVGVVMRLDYNPHGDLVYEASIPLQALYPEHVAGSPYPTQNLAVGFFIEPLPSGTKIPREGGGGGSGLQFGVGGGVGTFGSGMGLGIGLGHEFGGGGSRRAARGLFDEAQIWQMVQLAHK